jgi:hypothetical protein
MDQRDVHAMVELLASDAHVSFNDGQVIVEGRGALERELERVNSLPLSIHDLANASLDLQGRKGVVYAIAYLKLIQPGGEARMLVRALRYDDAYVHERGQWRFQSRAHHPLWQYEADCVGLWDPR